MILFPKAAVCAAAKCAGDEHGSRWALNCARISGNVIEAIDGRRVFRFESKGMADGAVMARAEDALKDSPNGKDTAMVDAEALREACGKDGYLAIKTDGETVTAAGVRRSGQSANVTAMKADHGLFPNTEEIIPKADPTFRISFNPRLLGELLIAIAPLASDYDAERVTFEFKDAKSAAKLTARGAEGEVTAVIMPVLD